MSFELWFARKYPKLRESIEFGMMGPDEIKFYVALKEAYAEGYLTGVADSEASHADENKPVDP